MQNAGFSAAPAGAETTPHGWEGLALVAVAMAVAEGLGRGGRRRMTRRLRLIAEDWERQAAQLPAGGVAAARVLRPTLGLLQAEG